MFPTRYGSCVYSYTLKATLNKGLSGNNANSRYCAFYLSKPNKNGTSSEKLSLIYSFQDSATTAPVSSLQ